MNIKLFFFSATGNTARMAKSIKDEFERLGAKVELHDITPFSSRNKTTDVESCDAVVFGAPIYSWRAPREVREWMKTLAGCGKKCSMFFTYGGFGVHPTHYSTRKILEERGFIVVSSAEFLAPHTFNLGGWRAMTQRPDEGDFGVAREYVQATMKRFSGYDSGVPGEMEKTGHTDEQLDAIESVRFKILTQLPARDGKDCSMCMICEDRCPTAAFSAEKGEADKSKCIACLSCVANCPENVVKINDMSASWSFKLQMEKTTEEKMNEQRSRIYL